MMIQQQPQHQNMYVNSSLSEILGSATSNNGGATSVASAAAAVVSRLLLTANTPPGKTGPPSLSLGSPGDPLEDVLSSSPASPAASISSPASPASPADHSLNQPPSPAPMSPLPMSSSNVNVVTITTSTTTNRIHIPTPMPLVPQMCLDDNGSRRQHLHHQQERVECPAAIRLAEAAAGNSGTQMPPGYRTDPTTPPGSSDSGLSIVGGRFILMDQLEGSHLQRCIEVGTGEAFVCKVF